MGWSCSSEAGRALDRIVRACARSSGQQNVWLAEGGERFFFEIGREQSDGAITGSVWRSVSPSRCRRAGSFRVENDGTVSRGPAFLRRAAERPAAGGVS